MYFALVLVEFICQFFPDANALKDWKYKVAAIDESSEDYYEKKPLLDRSQNGAEFLYDEVIIFNVQWSFTYTKYSQTNHLTGGFKSILSITMCKMK